MVAGGDVGSRKRSAYLSCNMREAGAQFKRSNQVEDERVQM